MIVWLPFAALRTFCGSAAISTAAHLILPPRGTQVAWFGCTLPGYSHPRLPILPHLCPVPASLPPARDGPARYFSTAGCAVLPAFLVTPEWLARIHLPFDVPHNSRADALRILQLRADVALRCHAGDFPLTPPFMVFRVRYVRLRCRIAC